jgi:hypothetical protein
VITHRPAQRRILSVLVAAQVLSGAGLAAGITVGAIGAIGVVIAATTNNVVLLFVALFVYGAGSSTNLQDRCAGVDLADPQRRGRAVSTVLVEVTWDR